MCICVYYMSRCHVLSVYTCILNSYVFISVVCCNLSTTEQSLEPADCFLCHCQAHLDWILTFVFCICTLCLYFCLYFVFLFCVCILCLYFVFVFCVWILYLYFEPADCFLCQSQAPLDWRLELVLFVCILYLYPSVVFHVYFSCSRTSPTPGSFQAQPKSVRLFGWNMTPRKLKLVKIL